MPTFVILIVISLAFYVFYKIKFVRSSRPVEKKWLSSKSSIALGIFVSIFGINQVFLYQTTLTYIIAAIFLIIGGLSIWSGIKAYQHYLPYAIEEAENFGKQN
ncbi:YtpI family protein [Neobacillus sp. PS3-34]|uniref:YtpI family protein n=1 Tax=Neobacillus sp. PS3-34 TaxID=3070678 RepID=UPI0027E146B9|nr:YtpI family protein [Neobacillus sp. PS3-34]WML47307.1 YtpI family protein [Neobacillus sp. PS3-34]